MTNPVEQVRESSPEQNKAILYRQFAIHVQQEHKGIFREDCNKCQMFRELIGEGVPSESVIPRPKTP